MDYYDDVVVGRSPSDTKKLRDDMKTWITELGAKR